jgi:transcriptional regulator with XRE-family HTH domain
MTAQELVERRKALSLTQQGLAAALGVTQQTVNRWEHEERAIPSFLALALDGLEARIAAK